MGSTMKSLEKKRFKLLDIDFKLSNLYGLLLIVVCDVYVGPRGYAGVDDQKAQDREAEFDAGFLYGKLKHTDLSKFKFANPVMPGEYYLDVYVNEKWQGRKKILFKVLADDQSPSACFSREQVLNYGVKAELLDQKPPANMQPCQSIQDWVASASYRFDLNLLRIDISIAQIALNNTARDVVDSRLWDRGIDAAYLSYSAGAYTIRNHDQQGLDKSHVYLGVNSGINLASWQFRHQGQWNSTHRGTAEDTSYRKALDQSKSNYHSVNNYLQRAFAQYQAVLTLGDYYSSGEIFDSVAYRGVDFSRDERMLPNSRSGYAPQIRGIAKSHAKIEIRQQGQLIYQTTVAAGQFEINDLYATGYAGELNVRVLESNGEIQTFNVPYASVVQMLRPGLDRYSVTMGQYRDPNISIDPWFIQAKYQRGLNNVMTAYTGLQWAENYNATTLGAALGTPFGAMALDLSHARTTHFNRQTQSGQSYRVSYSKHFSPSATQLTLAAYRYSAAQYFNLRNAIQIYDLDRKGLSTLHIGKPRHEYQFTLNQNLAQGWGNIYAVLSLIEYWNKAEQNKYYTLGYSNQYKFLNYALTVMKRQISKHDQILKQAPEYLFSLSFPLDLGMKNIFVNTMQSKSHRMLSMTARQNEQFDYTLAFQHQDRSSPSLNLSGQYLTQQAALGAGFTLSEHDQQAHINMRGNIVAHRGGILFGAGEAQTLALVYAPHAVGANVSNRYGLKINPAGYAVIPYLTPYRFNDIELDPSEMSLDVELEETSQRVAPYAGAILKVDFATKTGYAIFIKARLDNGDALPFYAPVYNTDNELIAYVAQGGLLYIRSKATQGRLKVQFGQDKTQYCFIDYDLSAQQNIFNSKVFMTEAVCQS